MRPGEKLFEELASKGEDIQPTYHEKIRIFAGPRQKRSAVEGWLARLQELVNRGDVRQVMNHMAALVPEYRPAGGLEQQSRTDRAAAAEDVVERIG